MTSDFLANGGFLKKITEYGISEKRDFDHVGMVSSQQLNLTRLRLETIIKPNQPTPSTELSKIAIGRALVQLPLAETEPPYNPAEPKYNPVEQPYNLAEPPYNHAQPYKDLLPLLLIEDCLRCFNCLLETRTFNLLC